MTIEILFTIKLSVMVLTGDGFQLYLCDINKLAIFLEGEIHDKSETKSQRNIGRSFWHEE